MGDDGKTSDLETVLTSVGKEGWKEIGRESLRLKGGPELVLTGAVWGPRQREVLQLTGMVFSLALPPCLVWLGGTQQKCGLVVNTAMGH